MAVDVCAADDQASSSTSSPRISFSHDLQDPIPSSSSDIVPIEFQQRCLFDSAVDFDFHHCFPQEISPADELFADGMILPVQIKKNRAPLQPKHPKIASSGGGGDRKMLKEFLSAEDESPPYTAAPAKNFLKFRRSSSLSSAGGGFVRSLQFLARSNSTGSATVSAAGCGGGEARRKQRSESEPYISRSVSALLFRSQSQSQSQTHNNHTLNSSSSRNGHLKKSRSCRSSSSGVQFNPVLNISPIYISRNSFFGLGSLFCNGKSKKKKR